MGNQSNPPRHVFKTIFLKNIIFLDKLAVVKKSHVQMIHPQSELFSRCSKNHIKTCALFKKIITSPHRIVTHPLSLR